MKAWQFTQSKPTCATDTLRKPMDAPYHATGPYLWRVSIVGDEITTLWGFDATDVLRRFARKCALDVIHLWDAPDVVVRFLKTGDESLREAAKDAAKDAARSAGTSGAAGRDIWNAIDAAWYAGRSAYWAAWPDTGDAAWFAARSSARDAVWAVATDAWDAAGGPAWDAAAWGVMTVAWHAARHAAQAKQNRRLTSMAIAEAKRLGVYR